MNTIDTLGRPLRDLRISVTDKCNFRCVYCMPKEIFGRNYEFLAREKLLSFEELERLVRIFVDHGVEKIRLTGGEPLMRRDITKLIARLAQVPGVQDLTLTTNGSFPTRWVQLLKDAGLHRITVSLDSLDETVFRAMNDVDFPVARVLEWIEACHAAGLGPVKINMVVKRGVNEQSILPMARYFRKQGHILRFIEYMDVGSTNGWQLDQVVSAAEIVKIIDAQLPVEPANPNYYGEVANRWHYKDGSGEFGVVASVTQAFCNTCTRTRLSAEGKLYTCLFATRGHDFRALLRGGASDAEISAAVGKVWARRTDRYSEIRSSKTAGLQKIEMSYIGG